MSSDRFRVSQRLFDFGCGDDGVGTAGVDAENVVVVVTVTETETEEYFVTVTTVGAMEDVEVESSSIIGNRGGGACRRLRYDEKDRKTSATPKDIANIIRDGKERDNILM